MGRAPAECNAAPRWRFGREYADRKHARPKFDADSGDGRQGTIWVELYQHDELSRRFEPAAGPREVQIPWRDADWPIVRAEHDPSGNKGYGIYYGATHDGFSWIPRRVEWRHARTNELIGTLATYTVRMGRKLLMPQQHTMSRRAIKVWSKLRGRYSPTLPQSLDYVWRHNIWCPRTREYAWRVLSGLKYTPSMQRVGAGGRHGELASCMHGVYAS